MMKPEFQPFRNTIFVYPLPLPGIFAMLARLPYPSSPPPIHPPVLTDTHVPTHPLTQGASVYFLQLGSGLWSLPCCSEGYYLLLSQRTDTSFFYIIRNVKFWIFICIFFSFIGTEETHTLPIPEALAVSTVSNVCLWNQVYPLEDGEGQVVLMLWKGRKKVQEKRDRAIG